MREQRSRNIAHNKALVARTFPLLLQHFNLELDKLGFKTETEDRVFGLILVETETENRGFSPVFTKPGVEIPVLKPGLSTLILMSFNKVLY